MGDREAFERWVRDSGIFTDWSRDKTSDENPYHKTIVECAWQAWQAALLDDDCTGEK